MILRTHLKPEQRIIPALDTRDATTTAHMVKELSPYIETFKTGDALGSFGIGWRRAHDLAINYGAQNIFWDTMLHTNPATMAAAASAISQSEPWAFTVHASAGFAALRAAVENKGSSLIFAVTILTSLDPNECRRIYGAPPEIRMPQLALDALKAGADGVICSPQELAALNEVPELDRMLRIATGIRPIWAPAGNQKRVTTPQIAIALGADYLVIGGPILNPPPHIGSPAYAAQLIAKEIAAGSTPTRRAGKISRGRDFVPSVPRKPLA